MLGPDVLARVQQAPSSVSLQWCDQAMFVAAGAGVDEILVRPDKIGPVPCQLTVLDREETGAARAVWSQLDFVN